MRAFAVLVVVLIGISGASSALRAEQANNCKQCSDFRKRCMANYPGPTCKIDYDICMKGCRKK